MVFRSLTVGPSDRLGPVYGDAPSLDDDDLSLQVPWYCDNLINWINKPESRVISVR